ncbi:MAG: hypothetical protein R3Y40_09610 [Eubacteriales bacterium]
METAQQRWECIHHRLRNLDVADQTDEPALIHDAYELLVEAYQEARELNDEMNQIMKEFIEQEKIYKQQTFSI